MKKFKIPKTVHWLVLLIALSITLLIWESARRDSAKRLEQEFDVLVSQINNRIEKRVQDGRLILRATASLFNVTNTVTRQEYRDYIQFHDIPKNYPGIKSVAVSRLVQGKEKAKLLRQAKKEGIKNYRIWPEGERDRLAPIWFVEPSSGDHAKKIEGFDLFSEPAQRKAMERARDQGTSAMTELVTMMPGAENGPQTGFLVFAPIYRDGKPRQTLNDRRRNIIGWAHLAFLIDEAIQSVMGDAAEDTRQYMTMHIYFSSSLSEKKLIYESKKNDGESHHHTAQFKATRIIELPEKSFIVEIHSTPAFESRINDAKSNAILIAGTTASVLIAMLIWLLARGRERAVQLAKRMNIDLIESEKRYRQMFEDNASMVYIIDPVDGKIIDANRAAADFWGYTQFELRQMSIGDINVSAFTEIKHGLRKQLEGLQASSQANFIHRLKDGRMRDVEIYRTTLTHQGKAYIYCIAHDVTSRREAEKALFESESRLHAIFETAMDAVIQLDEKGIIIDWNRRAEKIFGWKRDEMIGKSLIDMVIPGVNHAAYQDGLTKFVDGEDGAIRHAYFEVEAKRRNGQEFPIEVAMTTMIDGEGRAQQCAFMHDITDRKKGENALRKARIELENRVFERTAELVRANRRLQAEILERTGAQEALQASQEMLRQLVAHQDRIRENERKRIAREIHDELGQHLLVLRIDVSMLGKTENDDPKMKDKVDAILQHIDTTMRSVRAIINNLRPSVLDLGLYAALEWQVEEFQRRSGIMCDLIADGEDMELDDSVATVLFRIVQEALTNVLRHAKATYVKVELRQEVGQLTMTIADNGIGMQEARKSEQNSFGLVGIRERLHILGGHLHIESNNNGTTLTVTVPL